MFKRKPIEPYKLALGAVVYALLLPFIIFGSVWAGIWLFGEDNFPPYSVIFVFGLTAFLFFFFVVRKY